MAGKYNFLIASERSGSNLISKMLNAHPEVCSPSPAHLLRLFIPKLDKFKDVKSLIQQVYEMWSAKLAPWKATFSQEELSSLTKEDCRETLFEIVKFLYDREAKENGKLISFIKENQTYLFYPELIREFVDARFIWLVRDPRDMALSWKNSPVHRGDILRASQIWKRDQKNSIELLKSNKNIRLLKYEDLISDPVESLKLTCQHIGIGYSDSMLSFNKVTGVAEQAQASDNWKNLSKDLLRSNSGKYKDSLTESQLLYIEGTCSEEMEFFGYERTVLRRLTWKEMALLHEQLLREERYNKPEFDRISEEEKGKRAHWMRLSLNIGS